MVLSKLKYQKDGNIVSKIQCCKCGNVLKLYRKEEYSVGCDGDFRFIGSYELCNHCGESLDIRNPSGYCDHLYFPHNCAICMKREKGEV
jgi:hypothetical protein